MTATKQPVSDRRTGWCNTPATDDPGRSHRQCDGVWNDKTGAACACPCHEGKTPKARKSDSQKKPQKSEKTPTPKNGSQKKSQVPEGHEALTCEACGQGWTRKRVRGRKPRHCPACK